MTAADQRRFKMSWFRGAFTAAKKKNTQLSKTKLVAMFCQELGTTKRTAKEIIDFYTFIKSLASS